MTEYGEGLVITVCGLQMHFCILYKLGLHIKMRTTDLKLQIHEKCRAFFFKGRVVLCVCGLSELYEQAI